MTVIINKIDVVKKGKYLIMYKPIPKGKWKKNIEWQYLGVRTLPLKEPISLEIPQQYRVELKVKHFKNK